MSDEELINETINLVTLNAYIDLINKEDENVVDHSIDYTYYKFFDPKYT